jgi:protein-disulfide isomerase
MNRKQSSFQKIRRGKALIILGISFAVIMVAGTLASTMSSRFGFLSNMPQQHSLQSQSASALIKKLSDPTTPNTPALGSSDAPVTLIEFGDYQCTYCHRFHVDTKDLILANFVNTGKVRFLFKDFPTYDLSADRASTLASEASYCAADQGKYWQYYNELYNSWQGENTGWVTKYNLKQFATSVGVKDISQFSQCLGSGKYAGVVADNFNLAQSLGLNATPTFVLLAKNGKQQPLEIVGAQPYSVFANAINQIASPG